MTERRATHRYDLLLPLMIRSSAVGKAPRNGKIKDISARGVYFVLADDISKDCTFDMTITLPTKANREEVLVHAVGRVVRTTRWQENGIRRFGIAARIERYEIVRNEATGS